jgi:PadR family transcriptional regulator PadR
MADRFRDNWTTQLRKGLLELSVLAALREERRYGYDLVQRLSQIPGLVIREGTVYPLLNRLKKEGFVRSELEESSEGPARKYYRLTQAGEEALQWMREEWTVLMDGLSQLTEKRDGT